MAVVGTTVGTTLGARVVGVPKVGTAVGTLVAGVPDGANNEVKISRKHDLTTA